MIIELKKVLFVLICSVFSFQVFAGTETFYVSSQDINVPAKCTGEYLLGAGKRVVPQLEIKGTTIYFKTSANKTQCALQMQRYRERVQKAKEADKHLKITIKDGDVIESFLVDKIDEHATVGQTSYPKGFKCSFVKKGDPRTQEIPLNEYGCGNNLELKMLECERGDFPYSTQVVCEKQMSELECLEFSEKNNSKVK